jgi:hypothetical protein
MTSKTTILEMQKTDEQGRLVAWLSDSDHSPPSIRKRASVFSARGKRCSVCSMKMQGTYAFTGTKEDFKEDEMFPRMAMHLGCAMKLNEEQRYPIVARNERYIEPLEAGYKIGRWVEFWRFDELAGKWQAVDGGHNKRFGEYLRR